MSADPEPLPPLPSRRDFLATSSRVMSGGWLALHLPALATLASCSREAAERGDPFTTLTPREAEVLGAFADLVLPADDLPGAVDAGVVHFMDGALGQLFPEMLSAIRPGVEELDRRALAIDPNSGGFAPLRADRQAEVIRTMEDTEFFFLARMLTVMGMFSDPIHGGNRDHVGWRLLGMEHAPAHAPPFGHYDAGYRGEAEA
jgi:gluconate 2-dehydrogenase gamma chain